jgi:tRNA-binding EMAP/Myf-like protein
VTIVTSAPNVREGSRVVVALAGSSVMSDQGEEIRVEKTSVGGAMSEGMMCDSKMLGWTGGASGVAVQVPESMAIGSAPPATKPRPKGEAEASSSEQQTGPVAEPLFEKKLTKEEKKKLANEKRAAKKAAKEAQN